MILTPECHLVGSGYLGFGLTSPWDSHVYLVTSEREALLIDAGCGYGTDAIADRIDGALGGSTRLVGIALTHAHLDHAGGAAELSRRYDVPVLASPLTAERLGAADEEAIGLRQAREDGTYPSDFVLRRTTVTPNVDPISVGRLQVDVHPTPGHSSDHLAYSVRLRRGLALFSGDLVFGQGRIALLRTHDADPQRYESSIRAIDRLRPDCLFPGHGTVVLTRAWSHLEPAVAAYDRGVAPAALLDIEESTRHSARE